MDLPCLLPRTPQVLHVRPAASSRIFLASTAETVWYDTGVRRFLYFFLMMLVLATAMASAASLVVLPLIPEANSTKYLWIGESNAETIGEILSANGVFVLDREKRLNAYRTLAIRDDAPRTIATNLKVAAELDADFAVFGSVEVLEGEGVADSRIALSVTMMDVRRFRKEGEIRLEGYLPDLAKLETQAAYLLLRELQPSKVTTEEEFLKRFPPVRLDARENYIRGLMANGEEAKHRYFTQAARLEESYAAPAFQLALIHWQKRDHRQASAWLDKVGENFPRYREAQFMLGVCEAYLGRYAQAETRFRNLYDYAQLPEVANNLAVTLMRQQKQGALQLLTFAVDRDPEDPDYLFNLGHTLWFQERYEDAAERFREVLDLASDDTEATTMLGRALQGEASRPARAAVSNLNRIKEDFEDTNLAVQRDAKLSDLPAAAPAQVSHRQ